jgi:hypothetical protein
VITTVRKPANYLDLADRLSVSIVDYEPTLERI